MTPSPLAAVRAAFEAMRACAREGNLQRVMNAGLKALDAFGSPGDPEWQHEERCAKLRGGLCDCNATPIRKQPTHAAEVEAVRAAMAAWRCENSYQHGDLLHDAVERLVAKLDAGGAG